MKIIIDMPNGSKNLSVTVGPSVIGETAPSGLSVALVLQKAAADVLSNTMNEAAKRSGKEPEKPSLILLPNVNNRI